MKNLKVRTKLIVSFVIVAVFTVVVGLVGVFGSSSINTNYTEAIDTHAKPLVDAGKTMSSLHAIRAEVRAAIIFSGDSEKVQTQRALVQGFYDDFEKAATTLNETLVLPETQRLYNEAMTTYEDHFVPNVAVLMNNAETGTVPQTELAQFMVDNLKPDIDLILANFEQCMTIKSGMLDDTSTKSSDLANTITIALIAVIAVAAAVSVFFALYISGLISKPLSVLTAFLKKAGTTGDISLSDEDKETIEKFGQSKDETGQCINGAAQFVDHVTKISGKLEMIASGDLTANVILYSDKDVMANSLKKTLESLNHMFGEINAATAQVAVGSEQIAEGAQALAQGSTEQAATVEELSAAASEIAVKTKENAKMASQAAKLADTIMKDAEKGSEQMNEMINAVTEINQASQSIGRVMKVIDDIAFQTNILALNAAVEAARAGQHGKGFAVVAEEVRNLAAKSAEAAKDTGSLIANSIEKAEGGAQIAKDTAASLQEIVKGIRESDQLMGEIAASSEAQTSAITQINNGIEQVTQVVQQNSATAEESAAASEELSSQARMLEELITEFKLKK